MTARPKVMVGSVVQREPAVVSQFLSGLAALESGGAELGFCFVDASIWPACHRMLERFSGDRAAGEVVAAGPGASQRPAGTDKDIWEAAELKNVLLARALERGCTHLLLADSGLLLPPPLLAHLLGLRKDIVAEVFWTEWHPGQIPLPSVWLSDEYAFHPARLSLATQEEKLAAGEAFLARLRTAGTFRVGGVSGCILISRAAMEAGAAFRPLENVSTRGDDRHFSIRAVALGFELWADTHYQPLHLYREVDCGASEHFWARWSPAGVPHGA